MGIPALPVEIMNILNNLDTSKMNLTWNLCRSAKEIKLNLTWKAPRHARSRPSMFPLEVELREPPAATISASVPPQKKKKSASRLRRDKERLSNFLQKKRPPNRNLINSPARSTFEESYSTSDSRQSCPYHDPDCDEHNTPSPDTIKTQDNMLSLWKRQGISPRAGTRCQTDNLWSRYCSHGTPSTPSDTSISDLTPTHSDQLTGSPAEEDHPLNTAHPVVLKFAEKLAIEETDYSCLYKSTYDYDNDSPSTNTLQRRDV